MDNDNSNSRSVYRDISDEEFLRQFAIARAEYRTRAINNNNDNNNNDSVVANNNVLWPSPAAAVIPFEEDEIAGKKGSAENSKTKH